MSEAASEIILLGGNSAEQVDKFLYVLTEMSKNYLYFFRQ